MKSKKVGIYGGTFSPPHMGHVSSAEIFLDEMKLDKLLIIPTYAPPHKQFNNEASTDERLEMCRLAFSHLENVEISDIEIKRGGKSYTYLTLEELQADDVELYMLVGTDMILTMDSWKNPERIFSSAKICYVRRESDLSTAFEIDEKIALYRNKYGASVYEIRNKVISISSSEIRNAISTGDGKVSLLPESVSDFISQRGLYR